MIERLPYSPLEYIIGSHCSREIVLQQLSRQLSKFQVADYVGDYHLRDPYDSGDLTAASAKISIEKNAPFLLLIADNDYDRQLGYCAICNLCRY